MKKKLKFITIFKKINKKKLLKSILRFLGIIAVLIIFAFIGAFYAIGERASNPGGYARKYFQSFLALDWGEMYDMSNVEESTFVNRQAFIDMMEAERIYGGITDYEFSEPVKEMDTITYTVNFVRRSNGIPGSFVIKLQEQPEKIYVFFSTWKVDIDNLIVENCIISVPGAADAFLDSISILKYERLDLKDKDYNYYVVDRLFRGDHTMSLATPYTGNLSFSEYIETNDYTIQVAMDVLQPNKIDQSNIIKKSKKVIKDMIKSVMDPEQTYGNVSKLFPKKKGIQAMAEASYNEYRNTITREDGSMLNSVNVTKMEAYITNYEFPSKIEVKIEYEYTFEATTGRTPISGLRGTYEGSGKTTSDMVFKWDGGTWKITDINLECFDYSPQQ